MSGIVRRIANGGKTPLNQADASHDIVIVGGGAAGVAVASSLLARHADLDIAIIDPADTHYYQPGWTLVGGGVFDASVTVNTMASVIRVASSGSRLLSLLSSPKMMPSFWRAAGSSSISG